MEHPVKLAFAASLLKNELFNSRPRDKLYTMETLNIIIELVSNILHWLFVAGVGFLSFCGLLMFLWLAVLQQRDFVYRRNAMPGTPCRYWDGEERFEGRIVKLESGVATIKDFLTGDIFYRNFKETEAL